MKVTKYKNQTDGVRRINAYFKHKELIKEGKMIPLGNGSKKGEPEYHKMVRSQFYHLDLYQSEEDGMEDFLSYLSDEVEILEGDSGFDIPLPDSSKEYIIIFNNKILLYFYFSDEYMGMGDSSQFVKIESILVPEGCNNEDVREVRDWLIKGGFKMLR